MVKLIFVGVDAAGKDTVIEELASKTGFNIVRGSSFEITSGKNENELFEAFMEFVDLEDVIINRYMYCNYVYAPLFKDYASITLEGLQTIEDSLQEDSIVIHLYADEQVIKERFESRGEDYVDVNKISTILNSYAKLLKKSKLKVMSYNTEVQSVNEIVKDILNNIK